MLLARGEPQVLPEGVWKCPSPFTFPGSFSRRPLWTWNEGIPAQGQRGHWKDGRRKEVSCRNRNRHWTFSCCNFEISHSLRLGTKGRMWGRGRAALDLVLLKVLGWVSGRLHGLLRGLQSSLETRLPQQCWLHGTPGLSDDQRVTGEFWGPLESSWGVSVTMGTYASCPGWNCWGRKHNPSACIFNRSRLSVSQIALRAPLFSKQRPRKDTWFLEAVCLLWDLRSWDLRFLWGDQEKCRLREGKFSLYLNQEN